MNRMSLMNDHSHDYAVVLTSCGRFDLLRQTIESFLRFADIPPSQFIIVEDSGDEKVRDITAGLKAPFEFVINRPRLGQAAAIDAGYACVKTPYIFHCEDDWEFFRTGFIAESLALLEEFPKVSTVMLRGRDEHPKLRTLPCEKLNGVRFFRAYPGLDKYYFGYGYNPGLRRMTDYQRLAPLKEVGDEASVSLAFMLLGFATAHLEIPAVCHTGWGQHQNDPTIKSKAGKSSLHRKIARYQRNIKHWKWRTFGLPEHIGGGK